MANKEAIVIVLDVGPSMGATAPGESSFLETSLAAINMILQRKMFSESKDELALVLCGTEDTENDLANDEGYEHISVTKPLAMVSWDLMEYVQNDIKATTTEGDILDAVVVGMDHVIKGRQGKRGFNSKRMLLFTDAGSPFGDDQLKDILASMCEAEIALNVIGPDLDDDDGDSGGAGPSKPKSDQQRAGEALLRHMVAASNGVAFSFEEVLPSLSYFQSRQVRPTPWKCTLDIGTKMSIPIQLFLKIKEAKAKTFKTVYAGEADADLAKASSHHLNDEAETEVEKHEVVQGYRYGNTLVPFSEEDKEAMKFKAEKCFKVLGFTKSENIKRSWFLGDSSSMVVAEKGDKDAATALSALIKALYETGTVVIVRRNYSNATSPRVGCLAPHIKSEYECLIYNELPFSEDLRQYTFGSLPLTEEQATGGKKCPTTEQLRAMDELIDSMDLMQAGEDDEECLKPKLTFNPHLQRLYQCLQHRALHPDDPLPDLSPVVANYLNPPKAVEARCGAKLEKIKSLFKLEQVAKESKSKTGESVFKDTEEPPAKRPKTEDGAADASMADLHKSKVTEVGTVTPVEDFQSLTARCNADEFRAACEMMLKRVNQTVGDSFGTQFYDKATDCVTALRSACIKHKHAELFNDAMASLKKELPKQGRKDYWTHLCAEKIGLITKLESESSKISADDAAQFMEEEKEKPPAPQAQPESDEEDLLDQM